VAYFKDLQDAPEYYAWEATYKNVDHTGVLLGCWKVMGLVENKKFSSQVAGSKGHPVWLVECQDCGYYATVISYSIFKNQHGCLNCRKGITFGPKSPNWQGGKFVPKSVITKAKKRIRKSGKAIPFDLDIDHLDEVWERQQGRCIYTGIPLEFANAASSNATASLDRIDSSKGYEYGNVQFVHKDVNIMKMDFSSERFVEVCKMVANNFKESSEV
jgi:hypothetical protein